MDGWGIRPHTQCSAHKTHSATRLFDKSFHYGNEQELKKLPTIFLFAFGLVYRRDCAYGLGHDGTCKRPAFHIGAQRAAGFASCKTGVPKRQAAPPSLTCIRCSLPARQTSTARRETARRCFPPPRTRLERRGLAHVQNPVDAKDGTILPPEQQRTDAAIQPKIRPYLHIALAGVFRPASP